MLVLRGGDRRSLNMRGAYLEVFGDLLGSIAALGAAAVILLTGFARADAIASLLIAAFIVPRAFLLLRDVVRVLTESAPRETDVEQIRQHLLETPGVVAVHDVHVWAITSGPAGVHRARRVRRRGVRSAARRARCSTGWGTASRGTSTSSTRPSSWSRPATPTARSTLIARRASAGSRGRAVEDYLKVIYGHTEWQPDPITPSQLAARLGLAPSTVTEMVKKLVAAGHVEHAPYGAVRLTDVGRAEALRMVRRHRLVETWLVQQYRLRLGRGARRGRGARAHPERPAARRDRRAARASGARSARRSDPGARRHGRDPGCRARCRRWTPARARAGGAHQRSGSRGAACARRGGQSGSDSELQRGRRSLPSSRTRSGSSAGVARPPAASFGRTEIFRSTESRASVSAPRRSASTTDRRRRASTEQAQPAAAARPRDGRRRRLPRPGQRREQRVARVPPTDTCWSGSSWSPTRWRGSSSTCRRSSASAPARACPACSARASSAARRGTPTGCRPSSWRWPPTSPRCSAVRSRSTCSSICRFSSAA